MLLTLKTCRLQAKGCLGTEVLCVNPVKAWDKIAGLLRVETSGLLLSGDETLMVSLSSLRSLILLLRRGLLRPSIQWTSLS